MNSSWGARDSPFDFSTIINSCYIQMIEIPTNMRPKSVVLLSGGLDSSTVLAYSVATGYETYALSVNYGQRHNVELECAKKVAVAGGAADHKIVSVDLALFGGSALTDDIAVPQPEDINAIGNEIPVTYVPARNSILLSLSLGYAETIGAETIFVGVNYLDYSGYPDCRPQFLEAFETMANLATKTAVEGTMHFEIKAPLLRLSKADIIQVGTDLGVDYSITSSCYSPKEDGKSCGLCDACLLRARGFEQAGIPDPAL